MKKKDISLILVIVIFSAIFSLVLSKFLISTPENRKQEVEVVEPITDQFTQPSTKYFNANSVNPTQLIQIGENQNNEPFTGE